MDDILHSIAERITRANKKLIVGISGHGASGKTTFANKLWMQLADQEDANVINTDPYIIGGNLRRYAIIEYEYEMKRYQFKMTACHPEAHHIYALERDIRMIRDGLDLNTIGTPYQKSKFISSQKKVTIIEGMTVSFVDPNLFDLKIYLYTDGMTELRRRGIRDVSERGADPSWLNNSHEQRRIQYELFMHPFSKNFDIVIKNSNEEVTLEKGEL